MKKLMMLFLLSILSFQVVAKEKFELSPEDKKIMKSLDDDTLLGPDKNNDGVRDDVEYWIKKHIKDQNVQKASLLYAKYRRLIVENVSSRKISNMFMKKKGRARQCIYFLSNSKKTREIVNSILLILNNNKSRISAYLQADRNYRGQSDSMGKSAEEVCSFKLNKN